MLSLLKLNSRGNNIGFDLCYDEINRDMKPTIGLEKFIFKENDE